MLPDGVGDFHLWENREWHNQIYADWHITEYANGRLKLKPRHTGPSLNAASVQ